MKILFLLLIITGVCLALNPDAGPASQGSVDPPPGLDDWTINITSVNDVGLPWAGTVRGCHYADNYGELLVTDYNADSIFSLNPATGNKYYGIKCCPEIPNVLGICTYQTPGENFFYVNDWTSVTEIWDYSSATHVWSFSFNNPSVEPRGMDIDPFLRIWEIDADSHDLFSISLAGTVLDSWVLLELPASYACGCCVFPLGSDLGVVIGGYAYTNFYFYVYDGSTLEYIGAESVPQTAGSSYGITYSYDTDSFYWIYQDGGNNFHLCEFIIDFVNSLEQNTWGAIKAGF